MNTQLEEERFVAYMDILGFRQKVVNLKDGEEKDNLYLVMNMLNGEVEKNYGHILNMSEQGWEYAMFSDSIAISVLGKSSEVLFSLLIVVIHMQIELLGKGIIIRGGIAAGELKHEKNLIIGKAMIEAVELEELAQYPRIVLTDKTIKIIQASPDYLDYEKDIISMVKKDKDGLYFVDFLSQIEEVDSNELYLDLLSKAKSIIQQGLMQNKNNPPILCKYEWLKSYYLETLNDQLSNDKIQSYNLLKDI
jgi:hypothetical protein